jgi:hypothetical protein
MYIPNFIKTCSGIQQLLWEDTHIHIDSRKILCFQYKESRLKIQTQTQGGERDAYRILVGKTEVRITLGRLRHRWEDDIKMDLRMG